MEQIKLKWRTVPHIRNHSDWNSYTLYLAIAHKQRSPYTLITTCVGISLFLVQNKAQASDLSELTVRFHESMDTDSDYVESQTAEDILQQLPSDPEGMLGEGKEEKERPVQTPGQGPTQRAQLSDPSELIAQYPDPIDTEDPWNVSQTAQEMVQEFLRKLGDPEGMLDEGKKEEGKEEKKRPARTPSQDPSQTGPGESKVSEGVTTELKIKGLDTVDEFIKRIDTGLVLIDPDLDALFDTLDGAHRELSDFDKKLQPPQAPQPSSSNFFEYSQKGATVDLVQVIPEGKDGPRVSDDFKDKLSALRASDDGFVDLIMTDGESMNDSDLESARQSLVLLDTALSRTQTKRYRFVGDRNWPPKTWELIVRLWKEINVLRNATEIQIHVCSLFPTPNYNGVKLFSERCGDAMSNGTLSKLDIRLNECKDPEASAAVVNSLSRLLSSRYVLTLEATGLLLSNPSTQLLQILLAIERSINKNTRCVLRFNYQDILFNDIHDDVAYRIMSRLLETNSKLRIIMKGFNKAKYMDKWLRLKYDHFHKKLKIDWKRPVGIQVLDAWREVKGAPPSPFAVDIGEYVNKYARPLFKRLDKRKVLHLPNLLNYVENTQLPAQLPVEVITRQIEMDMRLGEQ